MEIKARLRTIILGFEYYFFAGFAALFVVNLFTRDVVWAFFKDNILIAVMNSMISIIALAIAIKIFAPIFVSKIDVKNRPLFLTSSLCFMLLIVLLTSGYIWPTLQAFEKYVQVFNALLLVVFFYYFSFIKIIKV